MEHIIEGILIKYNEPILDRGTVIKPGAFDKHRVDSVPLLKDFDYKDKAVGTAELQYEEDGVYYTGMLFDTDESDEIIDLLTHDRQPTTEEMKIVNDISAAIAMLEEQS